MSETRARRRSTASGLLSVNIESERNEWNAVVKIIWSNRAHKVWLIKWLYLRLRDHASCGREPMGSKGPDHRWRRGGRRRRRRRFQRGSDQRQTRQTGWSCWLIRIICISYWCQSNLKSQIELQVQKREKRKVTGRIHQCRHLLLGEQPSSGSIRGPPSSCPARRPVAQRRLLPGRRRPAWRWPSATACRPKAWCCCWARRRTRLRSSPLERRVLHCERWPSCRIAWRLGFYASIFPVEEQEPN